MRTSLLFTFAFLIVTGEAAVPLRWTVETSRVQPAVFEAYQGETLELEATLQSYGKPITNALQDVRIYWQTNGMGSAYWSAPASADGNTLRATWTPSMDVGARAYNCFIGRAGDNYRAAFQLRMRASPGAVPNELELPRKHIDFAQVEVENAPWASAMIVDAFALTAVNASINATNALAKADAAQEAVSNLSSSVSGLANTKADINGDVSEDFNANNIQAYGNVSVSGDVRAGSASLADTADTAQMASSAAGQALQDAAAAQQTANAAQQTADSALSAAAEKIDSHDAGSGYSASWGEASPWIRGLVFRYDDYAGSVIGPYGIYSFDYSGNWVSLNDVSSSAYEAYNHASSAWSEIYGHVNNYYETSPGHYDYYTKNPHKVTAEQVGAPTVVEMEMQISQAVSSVTPTGIGAATSNDIASAISATNDHFKTEVLAAGLSLDPTAVAEINRIVERGSFESNCEVVVVRCIGESPVVRRVLIDSGKLYWDPVRQVTWQIDVSDGCFYSHIVSDLPPFGDNN